MELLSDGATDNSVDSPDAVYSAQMEISENDLSDISEFGSAGDIDAVLTDGQENVIPSESVDYSLDVDVFQNLLQDVFPLGFSLGFAFATILILLTYGVFKAFGLIRIKN